MILSVIVNLVIAACVFRAVVIHCRKNPISVVMRFFTVLSNLFCALSCLAFALGRLSGNIPLALYILKYMSTCAVTVTLVTVLVFLGPTVGYKILLSGPDFWLHLAVPVLAIVSFFAWDKVPMNGGVILLGALPVILYGLLYLYKVVLVTPEKGWEDFYGFNRGGKWPVSFAAMITGGFLISWLFWFFS